MALNFPASPVKGQIHNAAPGLSYIYGGPTSVEGGPYGWERTPISTALPGNYIVNPSMQISQENGVTVGTTNAYYMADQWQNYYTAAGAVINFDLNKPSNYPSALIRAVVTTGKASLAATDFLIMNQRIEGQRVSDFKWGTANAQQAVLSFTLVSANAGNFCICIRNSAIDRSFIKKVTITSANVYNRYTVVIPGDTTGTWLITAGTGINLGFGFAAGTSYNGVEGWQAGNYLSAATPTNHLVTGSQIHITDVGFYLDPYKTGVAPPFVIPDYATELQRCQRYWYRAFGLRGMATSATAINRMGSTTPVNMRVAPTATFVGAPRINDGTTSATMSGTITSTSTVNTLELSIVSAGMVAGRPINQYWSTEADYIAANART